MEEVIKLDQEELQLLLDVARNTLDGGCYITNPRMTGIGGTISMLSHFSHLGLVVSIEQQLYTRWTITAKSEELLAATRLPIVAVSIPDGPNLLMTVSDFQDDVTWGTVGEYLESILAGHVQEGDKLLTCEVRIMNWLELAQLPPFEG